MSVRVTNRVWEHSTHSGTELLMLLCIADFADDDGNAYPAITTLANKCRMTTRNAYLVLAELRASGELQVRSNEGPRGTNLYHVTVREGLKPPSVVKSSSVVKPAFSTPEASFPNALKPASDEPSLNRQEPSIEPTAHVETAAAVFDATAAVADADAEQRATSDAPYRVPPCPHNSLVSLFNEKCPMLPAVAIVSDVRRRAMQGRWREVCASDKLDQAAGLDFFEWFFGRVAESKFLTGRVPASQGRAAPFAASFDWLMSPANFTKVVEGNYHRGEKGGR